jgi:hypothetical protein
MQTVDHHFGHYYEQDPLGLVLTGTERHQSAFASLTVRPNVIIGRTEGDHATTSLSDLGTIAWPIVKAAMAGAGGKIERELEEASRAHNVAVGIDAVVQSVDAGVGATLLVEDGYRVQPRERSALLDDCDNVVDSVIEKVLAVGGNVLFVEDGSLRQVQRIALILRVPHHSGGLGGISSLFTPSADSSPLPVSRILSHMDDTAHVPRSR